MPSLPSVINRGISGNRLLGTNNANLLAGRSAQERFDRDVLATSGVRHLVLLVGIDDIGNSSAANPVTDFERVMRDPAQPSRLLPACDSGDHLHPGDLGYAAMGNAVPLEFFREARQR